MYRLFVGLDLSDAARDALFALTGGADGARWLDPDSYHLTLAFIGEVDGHVAEDIDASLGRVAEPAFSLTFRGMGTFGSGARMRALWVGVEPNPALDALQARVAGALHRAGVRLERRRFVPHVTLARFREADRVDPGRVLATHSLFRWGPEPVDRFCLFESQRGPDGAHYTVLRDYPLRDGAEISFLPA